MATDVDIDELEYRLRKIAEAGLSWSRFVQVAQGNGDLTHKQAQELRQRMQHR